jgi:hypothetical protein
MTRRTLRRILVVVGLSLLLILAFLVFTDSGRQFINTILNRGKPVSYLCPVSDLSSSGEVADCTDCTYYPVDRTHGLPWDYQPNVVDTGLPGGGKIAVIAREPLQRLFADAEAHGHSPIVTSAYRSYDDQVMTFRYWVFQEWTRTSNIFQAITNAEHYSAWEGHSEHQLGTAVDINCRDCIPFDDQDTQNLALWKYLENNAYRFGFVISYPRNMENRTGYQYEPWHVRYIGIDSATTLYEQGYTLGNGMCALTLLRLKAN